MFDQQLKEHPKAFMVILTVFAVSPLEFVLSRETPWLLREQHLLHSVVRCSRQSGLWAPLLTLGLPHCPPLAVILGGWEQPLFEPLILGLLHCPPQLPSLLTDDLTPRGHPGGCSSLFPNPSRWDLPAPLHMFLPEW